MTRERRFALGKLTDSESSVNLDGLFLLSVLGYPPVKKV